MICFVVRSIYVLQIPFLHYEQLQTYMGPVFVFLREGVSLGVMGLGWHAGPSSCAESLPAALRRLAILYLRFRSLVRPYLPCEDWLYRTYYCVYWLYLPLCRLVLSSIAQASSAYHCAGWLYGPLRRLVLRTIAQAGSVVHCVGSFCISLRRLALSSIAQASSAYHCVGWLCVPLRRLALRTIAQAGSAYY